ncbi:reverse transcriptase domain-containing protein, partial [Tanacetum coccineum]
MLSPQGAVLPPGEEDSIFIEIPKPKAKEIVLEDVQATPFRVGLKDALVEMPKFNKWLSSFLRNKEKLEEIAIMTVNAECSAIIMKKVPEKLKDPGKFLIPCALQEVNRTSALADSGASINLLPHSIYKKLELEALTPTRMTLELANRSITYPMGIAEDVVVIVDGFTFLADFMVVNFEPDPRVPIILGRPFLRTTKALIDLYKEKLTLRVGKEELVYYADKSEKNKEKNFVHAISIIDFSKDDPFSGSTTNTLPPSSSPMKTSDNLEKFTDELAPLDSLPPGNDDSTLKKDLHEENFQEDVEIKNSNVSDKLVFLNTPLSDKDECFAPEDDNDEIDDFLAIEVSSNLEEGYFDSEGDIAFLDNLLSDDDSHNLDSKVTSDHEPEQNESSITFSPRSDPLHHEFAGEPLTLPARNDREFEEYLSLMTVLNEISTSQGNFHQNSVIESLPMSPILVEDSEPTQEEIDILLVPDNLIPPGVEDADSEDEVNESPNLDHQDDPSIPRPPPEPPDIKKCFEPKAVEEIKEKEDAVSSDFPIHAIVMPIRITFENPIDFNDHFSKPKDFKKDLTISFDSSESSILPSPLLDSDSPFTTELSASVTLNSLGNEDKVFKPGILVYHAIHDKNLVTLEENLKENISSGTLLVFKEPSFLLPSPDKCLNFEPILVMKNVVFNEAFYQSNVEDVKSFTNIIWIFLPYFPYTKESPLIFSFRSENFVFDPGIVTFHKPV